MSGIISNVSKGGGGGGSALPAPYTAAMYGDSLIITAPDGTSPVPFIIRGLRNTSTEDPVGSEVIIEGGGNTHSGGNDTGAAILRGGQGTGGAIGGNAIVEGGASSDPLNGGNAVVRGGVSTATDGKTGDVYVETQMPEGDGASGKIAINTGATSPGNGDTGTIGISTGDAYGSGRSGDLGLGTGDANGGGNAGSLSIRAGSATVSGGEGGDVTVTAGATAEGNGGNLVFAAGTGGGTAQHGGNITVTGGAHAGGVGAPGKGGDVTFAGGASANDTGGVATLRGGDGTSAASGGNARVIGGNAAGASNAGKAIVCGGTGPTGGDAEISAGYSSGPTAAKVSIGALDSGGTHVPAAIFEATRQTFGNPAGPRYKVEVFAAVTTSAAAPTASLLDSFSIPTNRTVTVIAETDHDDGTDVGTTTYRRTFRRGAGSATQKGTEARDISADDSDTGGHQILIALNGDDIEVKAAASSATPTNHLSTITYHIGVIA